LGGGRQAGEHAGTTADDDDEEGDFPEMSRRRFRVTVDGETFEVEVEELTGGGPAVLSEVTRVDPVASCPGIAFPAPPPAASASQAATGTAPRPERVPSKASRSQTAVEGEVVRAPLPGAIIRIMATPGQAVRHGQAVVILEAMKMENEIVSPRDGVVCQVLVQKGDTVAVGDPLVTLE
jgi:biotin carboxyl carrier protein